MAYRLDIANIVAAAFTRGAVKSSNSNGIACSSTGEGELVQLISLLCLRSMLDSPLIALSFADSAAHKGFRSGATGQAAKHLQ